MANYNPPVNPFPIGNTGKPKGVTKKTLITRTINSMDGYINETMIPTLVANLETLDGRDYVVGALALLEYYKPKLARKELIELKEKQVINIVGKVKNKPQIRKEPDEFSMFPADDPSEDIPFAEEV